MIARQLYRPWPFSLSGTSLEASQMRLAVAWLAVASTPTGETGDWDMHTCLTWKQAHALTATECSLLLQVFC